MPSVLSENICFPCAGQSYNHFHTYFIMGTPFLWRPWNPFASKGPVRGDDTREVKRVRPENGCFPICYPSTFQSLVKHLQAVTKYRELFIRCISAPACCLAHRWVRLREPQKRKQKIGLGNQGREQIRPRLTHPNTELCKQSLAATEQLEYRSPEALER